MLNIHCRLQGSSCIHVSMHVFGELFSSLVKSPDILLFPMCIWDNFTQGALCLSLWGRLYTAKTKTCTGLISRESPQLNALMKISAGPRALHSGHCPSEEEMQRRSFTIHHVYVADEDILCTRINVFWTLGEHDTSIIETCCAFLWLFWYFGVHSIMVTWIR